MQENHIENFRKDFNVIEMSIDAVSYDSYDDRMRTVTFKLPLSSAENLVKDNYYWRQNFRSRASEAQLREKYPAVNLAYEQYKLMLTLVQD